MTLSELRIRERELSREIRAVRQKIKTARPGIARPRAPGPDPEARRQERNERVGKIRAAVMARADGRCELCGREGFVLELEHVISGGLRRYRESVETCLASCADCHRARHRNDRGMLRAEKEWAIRGGFREALAAVERRLDKLESFHG